MKVLRIKEALFNKLRPLKRDLTEILLTKRAAQSSGAYILPVALYWAAYFAYEVFNFGRTKRY